MSKYIKINSQNRSKLHNISCPRIMNMNHSPISKPKNLRPIAPQHKAAVLRKAFERWENRSFQSGVFGATWQRKRGPRESGEQNPTGFLWFSKMMFHFLLVGEYELLWNYGSLYSWTEMWNHLPRSAVVVCFFLVVVICWSLLLCWVAFLLFFSVA